jgi:DNA-binding NarL/FixJ family response regulator
MDERIRRLVMSQPIPMRLADAVLACSQDVSAYRSPERLLVARKIGLGSLDPADLTPALRVMLTLICHGHTNREIAAITETPFDTVRERVKGLLAVFDARNRAHLVGLAVAHGYVSMESA